MAADIDMSPGKDIVRLDGLLLLRAATSRKAGDLLAVADLPDRLLLPPFRTPRFGPQVLASFLRQR